MTTGVLLTDMPEVVMNHIMEELNLKTILVLRKVCHSLRDFIDSNSSGPQLIDLLAYVNLDSIELWVYSSQGLDVIDYKKQGENGCKLVHDQKESMIEKMDYVDAFLNDFQFFIDRQKEVLRTFQLQYNIVSNYQQQNESQEQVFIKILNWVSENLEKREEKLKTEEFRLSVANQDQLLSVLQFFDPKSLKNLSIKKLPLKDETILELSKIIILDQWKHAETVFIENTCVGLSLENLTHFSFIRLVLQRVDSEGLNILKENILHSSKPKEFELTYVELDEQEKIKFFEPLGPPTTITPIIGPTVEKYSIEISESEKMIICHVAGKRLIQMTNIQPLENGIVFF